MKHGHHKFELHSLYGYVVIRVTKALKVLCIMYFNFKNVRKTVWRCYEICQKLNCFISLFCDNLDTFKRKEIYGSITQ